MSPGRLFGIDFEMLLVSNEGRGGGEVNPFKIAVDKKLYSILRKMPFQCSVVITFTRGVCKLQASHE